MSEKEKDLDVINGEFEEGLVKTQKIALPEGSPIAKFMDMLSEANPSVDIATVVESDEAVEKFAQKEARVPKLAIKLTYPKDWISRNGKPDLWSVGAERIARALGITIYYISDPTFEKYTDHQGDPQWMSEVKVIAFHDQLGMAAGLGTRTTESGFFSGDFEANLKKSAMKNATARVIKQMFGLNGLTWDYLTSCNPEITEKNSIDVKYEDGKKGGRTDSEWDEETTTKAKWIYDWVKEMTGGDPAAFKKYLKDVSEFTLTKGKDKGKVVEGKEEVSKLSAGRIAVVYGKVKEEYEDWKSKQEVKNGNGNSEQEETDRVYREAFGEDFGDNPGPTDGELFDK